MGIVYSRSCQIWGYCLQPVLPDLWVLFTAGLVRYVGIVYSRSCQICGYCLQPVFGIDVSGPVLSPGGDSVRPGLNRLVSGGVSDGNRLLVTMSACTLTGGLVLCDWLHSVTRGVACGSSNQRESAHRCWQRLGRMYMDCVHSAWIS